MNKLTIKDCCVCKTKEERNYVLEVLHDNHINIFVDSWSERNDKDDFETWPVITVDRLTCNITVSATGVIEQGLNCLSVKDFLNKAGIIIIKPQGDSRIIHHFLTKKSKFK